MLVNYIYDENGGISEYLICPEPGDEIESEEEDEIYYYVYNDEKEVIGYSTESQYENQLSFDRPYSLCNQNLFFKQKQQQPLITEEDLKIFDKLEEERIKKTKKIENEEKRMNEAIEKAKIAKKARKEAKKKRLYFIYNERGEKVAYSDRQQFRGQLNFFNLGEKSKELKFQEEYEKDDEGKSYYIYDENGNIVRNSDRQQFEGQEGYYKLTKEDLYLYEELDSTVAYAARNLDEESLQFYDEHEKEIARKLKEEHEIVLEEKNKIDKIKEKFSQKRKIVKEDNFQAAYTYMHYDLDSLSFFEELHYKYEKEIKRKMDESMKKEKVRKCIIS